MRIILFILFCLVSAGLRADIDPATTIVLANDNAPDGILIAKALMRKRGIPEANLITLPLPTTEEISWEQYSQSILNPLRRQLLEKKFISGKIDKEKDQYGREDFIPTENPKISWLITVYGVPLKIKASGFKSVTETREVTQGDQACVDSELSLLAAVNLSPVGAKPNPWFGQDFPDTTEITEIFRTSRLDGPTPTDTLKALMGAWRAEERGLRGRSYVDVGGPYKEGDIWFKNAAEVTQLYGFPTDVDSSPKLFDERARSDAPAFYLGWYTQNPSGRFALPRVKLAPGAIALHLHSYSARSLKKPESNWAALLVRQGAGLTSGNVYEPFLGFTMRPDFLVNGLMHGKCAGEAAWYATPVVSWQGTILGDPFYKPFAVNIATQLKDYVNKPDELGPYATIRGCLIRKVKNPEQNLELMLSTLTKKPSIPLAYEYAKALVEEGKPVVWPIDDWSELNNLDDGLVWELGQFLMKNGQKELGLKVLQSLIVREGWSQDPDLRKIITNTGS